MSSSGHDSTANTAGTQSSARGRTDPAWGQCTEGRSANGNMILTCLYCQNVQKGGGIYRMKQHLAGRKGQVGQCRRVPADVKQQMAHLLKVIEDAKKDKQDMRSFDDPYGASRTLFDGDDVDVQEISNPSGNAVSHGAQPKGKAKQTNNLCTPLPPEKQPSIRVGLGYKAPTYHQIRVTLLRDMKKEVSLFVESMRSVWAECGCTVMGDGWSDGRQRSLINFLVYCPKGITFVKSVDASDAVKDADLLFKLFQEVIEWVGPTNVFHMVTDNGANYKKAGKLISDHYENISWSPCAAHCLNLIFADLSKMKHIADLSLKASKITRYIYNHGWLLAWLRKRKDWIEVIRPGPTRFATTFIALHSLYEHMHDLQALVTSREFRESRYAKEPKGKLVASYILDKKFWNDCLVVTKIVEPLMRVLRIVDMDDKPSIRYVYDGMYRARRAIKRICKGKKSLYKPYTSIIKDRWDRTLRREVHAAAYWLNPTFQYDKESFCGKGEVMHGILDVIDTKASMVNCSKRKLLDEMKIFREQEGSFGRELALSSMKNLQPDEWWRLFGSSAPNLQKLAIKILGQTSSSSGSERNWNLFDRVHTKKRNRLEHKRLNDLVYVHYNLRLKNRLCYKRYNKDPIDYESIDKTEFWILEDEDEPFLDFDQVEDDLFYEEYAIPHFERQRRRCREDGGDEEENFVDLESITFDDVDFSSFDCTLPTIDELGLGRSSHGAFGAFDGTSGGASGSRLRRLVDEVDDEHWLNPGNP